MEERPLWSQGYTLATTYKMNHKSYLLMYKRDTGDWNISEITNNHSYNIIKNGRWTTGYTSATTYKVNGKCYLLMHKGYIDYLHSDLGSWNSSEINTDHSYNV